MLLRRVIEHVRAQNWTAVALDFVIVVTGVFIGIQVSNWNEERAIRKETVLLSERLKREFGLDTWIASAALSYHKGVYDNAVLTLGDLTGKDPLADEQLVIAAFRASQFNRFNPSSAFDELVATGGLALIEETPMGLVAKEFYENTNIIDMQNDGRSSEYRRLFRSIVPIDVQVRATERCGDRNAVVELIVNEIGSLDYDCELDLPPERVAAAAAAIRQDMELQYALRHRAATLYQQNKDYERIVISSTPYRSTPEELAASPVLAIYRDEE